MLLLLPSSLVKIRALTLVMARMALNSARSRIVCRGTVRTGNTCVPRRFASRSVLPREFASRHDGLKVLCATFEQLSTSQANADFSDWGQIVEAKKQNVERIDQYLNQLSNVQKEAVTASERVVRVIAGPGSGKTRVLVGRAAYLVGSGVSPEEIMMLTFTNKAAKEMKSRLQKLIGEDERLKYMKAGTFHRICNQILRQHVQKLKDERTRSYQIIDDNESRQIILQCLMERDGAPIHESDSAELKKAKRRQNAALRREMSEKSKKLQAIISRVKNTLKIVHKLDAEEVAEYGKEMIPPVLKADFIWCYDAYHAELKRLNLFDFDDLIGCALWLLKKYPAVLRDYQNRFQHICVDEMQDTDPSQYELLRILMTENANEPVAAKRSLFVVGDPNQSIYAFRGANMQNMMKKMDQDFKSHVEAKSLLENYRSTEPIIRQAERFLKVFLSGIYSEMTVKRQPEHKGQVVVKKLESGRAEAAFVASAALEQKKKLKLEWKQIAVLYRAHSLSKDIETALRSVNVPCFVHGRSFWEREEVRDIVAYLRILCNPHDELAFARIYNKPARGFGSTSFANAKSWCKREGKSFPASLLEDLMDQKVKATTTVEEVEIPTLEIPKQAKISKKAQKGLHLFRQIFVFLRSVANENGAETVIDALMKACGYNEVINPGKEDKMNAEVRSKLVNIMDLKDALEQMEDPSAETGLDQLQIFVQEASLLVASDTKKDQNGVQLMTVHAAKGLEFKVVFIVGCEEGMFPSGHAVEGFELEEEARTMFVAMTRAEDALFITSAAQRFVAGRFRTEPVSRFVKALSTRSSMRIHDVDCSSRF